MTVQEMLINVWHQCGDAEDLAPGTFDSAGVFTFDITAAGSVRLLQFLNRAYVRLANTKLPSGEALRFLSLTKYVYLTTVDLTATISSHTGATATLTGFSTTVANISDLVGFYIEINSVQYLIIAATGSTVTVNTSIGTTDAYAGTTATLYSKFFKFKQSTDTDIITGQQLVGAAGYKIINIESVQNITNGGQQVTLAGRNDYFYDQPRGRSIPTLYLPTPRGLEFNYPPTNSILLMVRYYTEPEALTLATQVPLIPSAWHEPLWMLAACFRLKEDKASVEDAELYRAVMGLIETLVQEKERIYDYSDSRLVIDGY